MIPPRLRAVAARIPLGARVADIGTDHARLPVFLMQRGLVSSVLATDIHPEPLRRARRLLTRCGLEGVIPLVLTDGLSGLPLHDIDIVVIAGLGADTILDIWRKNPPPAHVTGLLQPMSHAERLRAFFGESITDECLVQEEHRLYSIMTVAGDKPTGTVSPGLRYISRALECSDDPLLGVYLDRQIARLAAETGGLAVSQRPEDAARLVEAREALSYLQGIKGTKGEALS